MIIPPP